MGMEITFEHSSETFVNIRSIQVEDLTPSALRHILVGFVTTCVRLHVSAKESSLALSGQSLTFQSIYSLLRKTFHNLHHTLCPVLYIYCLSILWLRSEVYSSTLLTLALYTEVELAATILQPLYILDHSLFSLVYDPDN